MLNYIIKTKKKMLISKLISKLYCQSMRFISVANDEFMRYQSVANSDFCALQNNSAAFLLSIWAAMLQQVGVMIISRC